MKTGLTRSTANDMEGMDSDLQGVGNTAIPAILLNLFGASRAVRAVLFD